MKDEDDVPARQMLVSRILYSHFANDDDSNFGGFLKKAMGLINFLDVRDALEIVRYDLVHGGNESDDKYRKSISCRGFLAMDEIFRISDSSKRSDVFEEALSPICMISRCFCSSTKN